MGQGADLYGDEFDNGVIALTGIEPAIWRVRLPYRLATGRSLQDNYSTGALKGQYASFTRTNRR